MGLPDDFEFCVQPEVPPRRRLRGRSFRKNFVLVQNLLSPSGMEFLHGELTERIIGIYHDVYSELGYGFLEKLYQRAMAIALTEAGLFVSRDTRFDVMFRGHCLGQFFADLIVENRVLLEIKATSALQPSDEAQVLNYLRASTIELALLLNFGPKRELKRRVLTNDRKGASPRIDGET